MVVAPDVTPVSTPVSDPIVATAVLELIHVPPLVASLSVVVAPIQAVVVPVIDDGGGFMVNTVVAKQPVGNA